MSIFSKLFGKQPLSLPHAQSSSSDWCNFRQSRGMFSVSLPSDWREIAPISAEVDFTAASPAGRVLLEIFCVETEGSPGQTGFDAVAELSRTLVGVLRSERPDVREVWQGNAGTSYNAVCRRVIVEYTERFTFAGKTKSGMFTTDYFLIGTELRLYSTNFKLLSSEYSTWASTFERIVTGITIPHVSQIRILSRDSLQAAKSSNAMCDRERACALEREGKLEEALEILSRAIREEPGNATAYADRGVLLSLLCRYDQSVSDYTRALGVYPSDAVTFSNRAIAYIKLGKSEEALGDINHLALDPTNTKALANKRVIQSLIGKLDKTQSQAASECQAVSRSQTGASVAAEPIISGFPASNPSAARSPSEPVPQSTVEIEADLYAKPISRDRMDLLWLHHDNLPTLKAALEDPGDTPLAIPPGEGPAVELNRSVIDRINRGAIRLEDLIWALEVDSIVAKAKEASQAENYIDALSLYRQALRRAPGCDLYLMSIGSCYGNIGQLDIALRYVQQAAEINPSNPRIARNLKHLKELINSRAVAEERG